MSHQSQVVQRLKHQLPTYFITDNTDNKQCKICISEYKVGDQIRTLPCFHGFHVDCIDSWFDIKIKCPLCQRLGIPIYTVYILFAVYRKICL